MTHSTAEVRKQNGGYNKEYEESDQRDKKYDAGVAGYSNVPAE